MCTQYRQDSYWGSPMFRMIQLRMILAATLLFAVAATSQPPAVTLALAGQDNPGPEIYTAGRLAPEDVARLQAAGIRHVIDLTLDSETPDFDEGAAIREAGLAYDNLPIAGPGALTRENAETFDALLRTAGRPLLVHCASSNRVGAMAALRAAWIKGKPVEEAIAEGRAWGLKSLEEAVRARLGTAAPSGT